MAPRLLLFDPYVGGHHADHVRYIARAWQARGVPGRLVAAVAPRLLTAHPALADLAYEAGDSSVAFAPIVGADRLETARSLTEVGRINGELLRQVVEEQRPERALLLYLDHLQLALAMGLRVPAALSGILFRPELHYPALGHRPEGMRARVHALRKNLVLRAALRHPRLTHVFSLDPTAVPALQRLGRGARAVHLPDPTPPPAAAGQTPAETRRAWGVDPNRRLAVLFGSLEERKGVLVLLEALLRLPEADARALSVVVAGRSYDEVRPRMEALAARIQATTSLQLIVREEFIPDEEVQGLIEAADIILAPYQRHVGSSGIVMRAGAAGVPLLAQDYGLVGHQVRSAGLGWSADTTDPDALAQALSAAAAGPPPGFDPARARAFVAPYSEDAYVDALFANLLGLAPIAGPVPT